MNNYNFCDRHTDRQTWRLYDRPGPEGRVGENKDPFATGFVVM